MITNIPDSYSIALERRVLRVSGDPKPELHVLNPKPSTLRIPKLFGLLNPWDSQTLDPLAFKVAEGFRVQQDLGFRFHRV